LQLLHAEGVRAGGSFAWAVYFAPEPELLARFDTQAAELDWSNIEPEFS